MYIVHVFAHVKPEFIEAFKAAAIDNASNSIQEAGVIRFDVVQQRDDPARFVLQEVYRDEVESLAAHRQSAHFARWRKAIEAVLAEPFEYVKYNAVFPPEEEW